MKTNKFATKRLKLTKKGKVLFRPVRQNHFNAKQTGDQNRNKRGTKSMAPGQTKVFKRIMER